MLAPDSSPALMPVTVHATTAAPTHGYARAKGDVALLDDEPRVHSLISERRVAKRSREFTKADALREELRRELNVELFDKTMIWKVVGSQGHVPLPSGQESGRVAETPAAPAVVAAAKIRKKQTKAAKKTAAAVAAAPISTGFGHDLLLKMGWGGQGSGLRQGAIAEPVKALKPEERLLRQAADEPGAATKGEPPAKGEPPPSGAKKRKQRKRKAPGETPGETLGEEEAVGGPQAAAVEEEAAETAVGTPSARADEAAPRLSATQRKNIKARRRLKAKKRGSTHDTSSG